LAELAENWRDELAELAHFREKLAAALAADPALPDAGFRHRFPHFRQLAELGKLAAEWRIGTPPLPREPTRRPGSRIRAAPERRKRVSTPNPMTLWRIPPKGNVDPIQ